MALDHSCQTQRRPLSERGHDLYETPDVATEALLRREQLPHRIWEPCCGPGAIVNVLCAHGHEVYASDLVDYGTDPTAHYGRDFLLEQAAPEGIECIVTNPAFKFAASHSQDLVGTTRAAAKVRQQLARGYVPSAAEHPARRAEASVKTEPISRRKQSSRRDFQERSMKTATSFMIWNPSR